MKILALLIAFAGGALAQSPVERFPWKYQQAPAQQYETYRQSWLDYRDKVDTFQRSRRWQRVFVVSSLAVVGSAVVYGQSRALAGFDRPRGISLGVGGALLAVEFLTNRDGRRDKSYGLLNLGISGGFVALTIRDQMRQ